jgi:peroxiredoxin
MATFIHKFLRADRARAGLALASAAVLSLFAAAPARAQVKVGDMAPAFTAQAALAGESVPFSLEAALKSGPVVLFFYPKSFTSVCTEEAHLFAEAMADFTQAGAKVIGVSSDTIDTQRKFSSMECRDAFPVAADPEMKVIKAYGVGFGLVGAILPFADRVSFVIAPDGRILSRVKSGDAAPHVDTSLAAVKAWKAGVKG